MSQSSGRLRLNHAGGLAGKAGMLLAGLVAVVLLGKLLSTGSDIAPRIAVGIVGIVIISFRPLIGMYACYVLLLIVPITEQRSDLVIFQSPLQTLAFMTILAAILRIDREHSIPRSRVYLPLALVVGLLATFALTGHGSSAYRIFYQYMIGVWPLPLVVLLVRTPKQARNVLVALSSVCVALTIFWLPGLLALAESGSRQLGEQIRRGEQLAGYAENPGAVSLLGTIGALSVQTLVALALAAPVLLAVAMTSRRWRVPALFGFVTIALVVFTATIATAVITLALGTILVVGLVAFSPSNLRWDRLRPVFIVIVAVAVLGVVAMSLPPAQHAVERIMNPNEDISGHTRLEGLYDGWHAFLERPMIGHGSDDYVTYTPQGWKLDAHNTWVVAGYQMGLVFLIPLGWLLVAMWRELWRLLRGARDPIDEAIAAGFVAALLAMFITGFLTPSFGQILQDTVIWTYVGLAIVWNGWRRTDPDARLLPEQDYSPQPTIR